MEADLAALEAGARRRARYFTLTHLRESSSPDDRVTSVHLATTALTKLINSLSWEPEIHRPNPVGPDGDLLRVDLDKLGWSASDWDAVARHDPYALRVAAAEPALLVRADWFVSAASRPPLYYALLRMPDAISGLEERLFDADVPQTRIRAGFQFSAVAFHQRVVERRESHHGYVWRTFDFATRDRWHNAVVWPDGPGGPEGFRPSGGEALFSLPNGLHGYLVVDAAGRRLDAHGPPLVGDSLDPGGRVRAGGDCMRCHADGIVEHPRPDEVRLHLVKRRAWSGAEDVPDRLLVEYAPPEEVRDAWRSDAARHRRALELCGIAPSSDPVTATVDGFERPLDPERAVAELGVGQDALAHVLEASPSGWMTRGEFDSAFHRLAAAAASPDVLPAPPAALPPVEDVWAGASPRPSATDAKNVRPLLDLERWDAASPEHRYKAVTAIWARLAKLGWVFERLGPVDPASAGSREIAIFRHARTDIVFALIPAGRFRMGDAEFEGLRSSARRYEVTISSPFFIATTECRRREWYRVVESPDYTGSLWDWPVVRVSAQDCDEFCRRTGLQLPTEAQREWAARGGTTTHFAHGDDQRKLADFAWCLTNSEGRPHATAEKPPNGFGLHDMAGNVAEWCRDTWRPLPAPPKVVSPPDESSDFWVPPLTRDEIDPVFTGDPDDPRVVRGGAYPDRPWHLRSGRRTYLPPGERHDWLGFRPSFDLDFLMRELRE